MEDQYTMADLRQLMNGGRSHFPPAISQHIEIFPGYRNLPPPSGQLHHHHLHQYDLMMTPGSQASDMMTEFRSDSSMGCAQVGGAATATAASAATFSRGFEVEAASFGGDGGSGRWPRQETLTLLEIRSRLDSKFKEANQKGPLWDEISRIMSEEYGYQRSGKKCREKFDNLYKYYKKTKEGKAGRQDGKHYRFFRQLEALYGETSNGVSVSETNLVGDNGLRFHGRTAQANQESSNQFQKHSESLSLSNSSEFDSSFSDGAYDVGVAGIMESEGWEKRRKKRGGKCWKAKVKRFIDSQMRKLIEKQEEWLDKLTKSLEQKERERMVKEEEWRKNEVSRIEREHRFWARERAWIEARDSAFMEVFGKLTGGEAIRSSSIGENQNEDLIEIMNNNGGLKRDDPWKESEIKRLIQLSGMEGEFRQGGEDRLWEEIRSKMTSLGYERSDLSCREEWASIKKYVKKESNNKKRKENSINFDYLGSESFGYDQEGTTYGEIKEEAIEKSTRAEIIEGSSPNHNPNANVVQDNCFRFLLEEGESLWENYGMMKSSKLDQNRSTS